MIIIIMNNKSTKNKKYIHTNIATAGQDITQIQIITGYKTEQQVVKKNRKGCPEPQARQARQIGGTAR